ncbi:Guanine-specific ribonuclease N1/T1 [Penicillium malachiteum]|uniref:Guanine-specific ribonuclease N1/T1 n=1 Tax=Penicillium malachiteum TaxID=1324776 RepID=UPI002548B397|nr:Guanine-specific ribonuclease N1/T1 [Penicillium malachiteum]KAJ5736872.1 Guanine-specific ribonuclease N1/T1 [Penicillium malachiteum]
MGKGKKEAKSRQAPPAYWYTQNTCLTKEQNKISQETVRRQLAAAPGPNLNLGNVDQKTKSGYPHKYFNYEEGPDKEGLFRRRTNSSTTSYREYPVMPTGPAYPFDTKPKTRPGAFRAITNQNKTFKGVICHNGENGDPAKGYFHRATETPR